MRTPLTPTEAPTPPLEKLNRKGPALTDFLKYNGMTVAWKTLYCACKKA